MPDTNFAMPTGRFAEINESVFQAIKQSYAVNRPEEFPAGQMVARVDAATIAGLKSIVLPNDNTNKFLCKNKTVHSKSIFSASSNALWQACATQVFGTLSAVNPKISKELIRTNATNLMSVVRSVIALDRSHFDDQKEFCTSLLVDRTGGGGKGTLSRFHADPYDRMYVIRIGARPTEIIDMHCASTHEGSLNIGELVHDLLLLAHEIMSETDHSFQKDYFIRQQQQQNHNAVANLAQLTSKWRLTNSGDVVVMDRNTIHRSFCPEPGDPQTDGLLINVGVLTKAERRGGAFRLESFVPA